MKSIQVGLAASMLTLVLPLLGNTALASEQVGEWYAAGLAVYIDPDSDRDLDNEFAGGQLSVGKAFSEHLNFEVEADYLEVDGDNGGDGADFSGLAVNAMYMWNRAGRFSPYLLGGVGGVVIDPNRDSSDTRFQAQAGPGFLLDLWNDRWALRAEALGRTADSDTDLLVNVGLQFAFGGKSDPSPAPVAAAAAVAAAPLDSDGDGVTDDLDQCPNTPAGTAVDSVGCPLDSDGDGVTDDRDQCPNTIKGSLVDADGCAYQLSGVDFAFDSAELSAQAESVLDQVAERLTNDFPEVTLTIEGHTDDRGAADYNENLSLRRAQATKDYLVSEDVADSRLSVVGRGESVPVADNETEEGREANRRVVLIRNQ